MNTEERHLLTVAEAKPWFSAEEAAAAMSVSVAFVYKHAPVRRIGRRVLVPSAWVYDGGDEAELRERQHHAPEISQGTVGVPAHRQRAKAHRDVPAEADTGAAPGEGARVVAVLHTYRRTRKRRGVPGEVAA